jgi:ClpP class serine protease
MQATYDTFVEKAAQGRNTTPEKIDAIAQGRVWTGAQAKQLGLVDELGGLQRALAVAKQRAKLSPDSEVELVVFPGKKSFYDLLKDPLGASERTMGLGMLLGIKDARPLQTLTAPLRCVSTRRAAGDHAKRLRQVNCQNCQNCRIESRKSGNEILAILAILAIVAQFWQCFLTPPVAR